ncbi:MAG: helix-turn-helix domain-containing protein [Planctomycetaceae bacterium]
MTNTRQHVGQTSPTSTPQPVLLTVREVADRLRLSIASVYVMIRQGTLIGHRLGGRNGAIRIRPEDIEACLQSTELVPASPKPKQAPPRVKLKHIRLR